MHTLPDLMHTLPTDAAIVLFTAGVLLIYIECNRPGSILPGAAGLAVVLLALFAVAVHHPPLVAVLLFWTSLALLLVPALPVFGGGLAPRAQVPYATGAATPLALSFCFLAPRPPHPVVHLGVSVTCALGLCLTTVYLTQIARRARRNKGIGVKAWRRG